MEDQVKEKIKELRRREREYFKNNEIQNIPDCIDFKELEIIVKFKLALGSFRPGFWKRIEKNNTEDQLQDASTKAFLLLKKMHNNHHDSDDLNNIIDACKSLTSLHGIGFATATFILSRYSANVPLMTDEALRWCKGLPIGAKITSYSEKDFHLLYSQLEKKVIELEDNQNSLHQKVDIRSAQEVVWASAVLEKMLISLEENQSSSLGGRRKRKIDA